MSVQGLIKPVCTVLVNVHGSKQVPRPSPETMRVGGAGVAQVQDHREGVSLGPTKWIDVGKGGSEAARAGAAHRSCLSWVKCGGESSWSSS